MPDKLYQVEVRTSPARRDEPIDPFQGEEWHPVRRPRGGIHKFDGEFEAKSAMARLIKAQPHALFRISMIDIGRHRRRI
jgi:hypothetical protein